MPETVTQKEGGEYPSGIRYDPIFESVRPGVSTPFEMPAVGEASATTYLPRRPFPTFNPEDYYANSDEFKNLLWRAGQFGLESLPPDQQNQVKAARNHYPQVDNYLGSIEAEKAEKEAQKLGGPKGGEEIAEFDPWDSRASALTHIQGLALIDKTIGEEAKAFKGRIDKFNEGQAKDKENSWKYSMGVSMAALGESLVNNIKELAWYAAQGQADTKQMAGEKPEEETTMQFLASLARENNDRAQNTVSGLIQFAPYMVPVAGQALFASDIVRHPEILKDLAMLTVESYENLYKAATGDPAAKEQLRQQPVETTFGLVQPFLLIFGIRGSKVGDLPMKLKDLNKVVDGITKDGEYPEFADAFRQAKDIFPPVEEMNKALEKPTEKPAIVETPDAQIKAIKEAPVGQLMTEAMQIQDVYSSKDLVDLYSLDKSHVEYLVSGGKTGKEPPLPADIPKLLEEKKLAEAQPKEVKVEEPKPDEPKSKRVYAYIGGKLMKVAAEPAVKPETPAPSEMIKGGRVIKRTEQMEMPVSEKPKEPGAVESKSAPELEVVPEAVPESEPAVETKAVKVQKEKIAQIEKDISEREKWIADLEGSKDPTAQSFALNAKLQIAERRVLLDDAKTKLEEIKKLPEEPEEPSAPAPEPVPEGKQVGEADMTDAFKKAGDDVGAEFAGMQEQAGGKPPKASFTVKRADRETTFYAESPEKVKAEYDRKMAEYDAKAAEKASGKPVAASEPKPTPPVKEEAEAPILKYGEAKKLKSEAFQEKILTDMKRIEPQKFMGGGLGAIFPFRNIHEKFAESLKKAEKKRNMGIEGRIANPPDLYSAENNDVGVFSKFRTLSNLLGSIPGKKKPYGEMAAHAHELMMEAEHAMMITRSSRGIELENISAEVHKSDWGKSGEKFWDHVEHLGDPASDAKLEPSSLSAARKLHKFMKDDYKVLTEWNRERSQPWVEKIVEKQYRLMHDLKGKALKQNHLDEIGNIVKARLEEMYPDESRIENYLPQMHPGNYDLSVVEMTESGPLTTWIGAAKNRYEAIDKIGRYYSEHENLSPEAFTITPRAFRGSDVLRTSQKNYYRILNKIADDSEGMVSKEAIADALHGVIGTKAGRKKFASFTQKREGYEGYSKNLPNVLSVYNQSFVRHIGLTDLAREVQPLIDAVKAERRPNTARLLEETLDYMWSGSQSKTSGLLDASLQSVPGLRDYVAPGALDRWSGYVKQGTNVAMLKTNPRFHLLNRLQTYQTLFPDVTIKEWYDGSRFYASPEGRAAIEKFGVGYTSGGKSIEGGRTWTGVHLREQLARKTAGIGAPETFNQEKAWAVMYKRAKNLGMSDFAANDYAFKRGQVYTQFLYLASDTPPAFRGPIGSNIFQFRRFNIKNLELGLGMIADKKYAGAAKWLGVQLLFGGLRIVTKPIVAIPSIGATVAYISAENHKKIEEEHGKVVADAIAYGLPGLVGMDMSYSFMLADMPYGASIPEKVGRLMLGPAGNIVVDLAAASYSDEVGFEGAAGRVGRKAIQKIPGLSFLEALDAFQKKVDDGGYRFEDIEGRLKYKADLKDIIITGLGGRTTKESEMDIFLEAKRSVEEQRQQCIERSARKIIDYLDGKIVYEESLKDFMDWNELWGGEAPIGIESIVSRAENIREDFDLDRFERAMKNAPKAIKSNWLFREGE